MPDKKRRTEVDHLLIQAREELAAGRIQECRQLLRTAGASLAAERGSRKVSARRGKQKARRLEGQGDGDLGQVVRGHRSRAELSQSRQAALDAELCGAGFTVDGHRVDPSSVVMFRPRADPFK